MTLSTDSRKWSICVKASHCTKLPYLSWNYAKNRKHSVFENTLAGCYCFIILIERDPLNIYGIKGIMLLIMIKLILVAILKKHTLNHFLINWV